jgi:diguanylate cyclase (GGDEF)-like protein
MRIAPVTPQSSPIAPESARQRAADRRLFPLAERISGRERFALAAAAALVCALIGFAALHTFFGFGGDALDGIVRDWFSCAVYVLVAAMVGLRAARVSEARGPWIAFAVGLSLYAAGNLLWSLWLEHVPDPPIPSVSDALWLSLYPLSYLGIGWLVFRSVRGVPAVLWLDGLIAGLGITAFGAAVVFEPVLKAATGDAIAVITNLAYPIADLVLVALVVGVLALRGWRPGRSWALLGTGFLVLCVADCIYLLQVASGTSDSSTLANVFYMLGVAAIAVASWQRPAPAVAPRLDGWGMLVVPGASVLAALGLIVYDHIEGLTALAFALAMLAMLASAARTSITFRDVRALARTRHEALTDDLTDLPNRRQFRRRLDHGIAEARVDGSSMALLVIDIDHFKELNDTLGHQAGDLLLRQIGPRLAETLRSADTVARLGGDEFAVVLAAQTDGQAAASVADKLRGAIGRPFEVSGLSLHVSASVGIALWPSDAGDGEELLRRADVAMYQAKALRTGSEFYAPDRDGHSRDRLALSGDLDAALRAGAIDVHFQPIADANSKRVIGVEALARWHHGRHGFIAPDVFVPMAEQAGLARALTRHVLDRAVAQCAAWRSTAGALRVSVNVTAADLHDASLPWEIQATLETHGLPAEALVLEITEGSVLSDPHRIETVLARIGALGVGLALDDFGTGYSSLTHLKTLPVGEVKIDRSFVATMASDVDDAAIVGSTINLAHSLGMHVVAEGVEDDSTWAQLAAMGCELIQGYALARPMPAGELGKLLPGLMAGAAETA